MPLCVGAALVWSPRLPTQVEHARRTRHVGLAARATEVDNEYSNCATTSARATVDDRSRPSQPHATRRAGQQVAHFHGTAGIAFVTTRRALPKAAPMALPTPQRRHHAERRRPHDRPVIPKNTSLASARPNIPRAGGAESFWRERHRPPAERTRVVQSEPTAARPRTHRSARFGCSPVTSATGDHDKQWCGTAPHRTRHTLRRRSYRPARNISHNRKSRATESPVETAL